MSEDRIFGSIIRMTPEQAGTLPVLAKTIAAAASSIAHRAQDDGFLLDLTDIRIEIVPEEHEGYEPIEVVAIEIPGRTKEAE